MTTTPRSNSKKSSSKRRKTNWAANHSIMLVVKTVWFESLRRPKIYWRARCPQVKVYLAAVDISTIRAWQVCRQILQSSARSRKRKRREMLPKTLAVDLETADHFRKLSLLVFTSTRAISKRHDYRRPLIVRRSAKSPEPTRSPLLYQPPNCLEETQPHYRPVGAGLIKIMLQWPQRSSHPSRQTSKVAVSSRIVQGLHPKCAPDSTKPTNSTVTVFVSREQVI